MQTKANNKIFSIKNFKFGLSLSHVEEKYKTIK